MKTLTILSALLILGLTSCKKDMIEKASPSTNVAPVSNFKDIKANQNFDWKTTKDLTLNVTGLKTLIPISKTLIVSSVDNKMIFHQALQAMDQNGKIILSIPSNIDEIKVTYGSIQKILSTGQSEIQFDYLSPITE